MLRYFAGNLLSGGQEDERIATQRKVNRSGKAGITNRIKN